jgi:two-component system chemotaxis response regulator CheB
VSDEHLNNSTQTNNATDLIGTPARGNSAGGKEPDSAIGPLLEDRDVSLRVIALVASAGGLIAVGEILRALPAGLNAAVIVLIHQEPDRKSTLVSLLNRRSGLRVEAAQDNLRLRAGTVVVVPPGKHALIAAGPRVALVPSGEAPPNRPSADLLLTTLATACGPRATAVVLTGGGHDGATGASAVQRFRGTVIASTELSSEHFSMPRATIERESANVQVVPLTDIASVLATVVTEPQRSLRQD